ncbi:MAG TPA: response regulator [Candidatus Acidoferrales bacterium]|nr:response regulator [Candidatus Acidoferrales bacterium]
MSDTFDYSRPGENPGAEIPAESTRGVFREPKRGETRDSSPDAGAKAASPAGDPQQATTEAPHRERRVRRRALISAPVRVRSLDLTVAGPDEVSTTLDVSRGGLLFASSLAAFTQGMGVAVTFPYTNSPAIAQAEQMGRIARVTPMPDGRRSVAVILGTGAGEVVDSANHRIAQKAAHGALTKAAKPKPPLVLIVDADIEVRQSLRNYLVGEGYEVIALGTAGEAHEVLKMFTPALLIAEIEGDDLPGYELCAHVKATPRLRTIPVILLTRSAFPSDYANAHSLGAVVCMAKPYRQERLGHVVRLLAPTPQAIEQTAPARAADPARRGLPRRRRTDRFFPSR